LAENLTMLTILMFKFEMRKKNLREKNRQLSMNKAAC